MIGAAVPAAPPERSGAWHNRLSRDLPIVDSLTVSPHRDIQRE